MGSHPSGESRIARMEDGAWRLGASLRELLSGASASELLGANVQRFRERFNSSLPLPFLFKVLSVRLALSIQIHPDKVRAHAGQVPVQSHSHALSSSLLCASVSLPLEPRPSCCCCPSSARLPSSGRAGSSHAGAEHYTLPPPRRNTRSACGPRSPTSTQTTTTSPKWPSHSATSSSVSAAFGLSSKSHLPLPVCSVLCSLLVSFTNK